MDGSRFGLDPAALEVCVQGDQFWKRDRWYRVTLSHKLRL
jgi:hypothetical protein